MPVQDQVRCREAIYRLQEILSLQEYNHLSAPYEVTLLCDSLLLAGHCWTRLAFPFGRFPGNCGWTKILGGKEMAAQQTFGSGKIPSEDAKRSETAVASVLHRSRAQQGDHSTIAPQSSSGPPNVIECLTFPPCDFEVWIYGQKVSMNTQYFDYLASIKFHTSHCKSPRADE
jgi:hypothetical protein